MSEKTISINEVISLLSDPESKMVVRKILRLLQDPETVDILAKDLIKAQAIDDNEDAKTILESIFGVVLSTDSCLQKNNRPIPMV